MKKYKLIRKYPGSPTVGTILAPKVDKELTNTNNFYWGGNWFNPNDFTFYWEEVVEKDYEIISFTQDSGITDLWTKFPNGWARTINGHCATTPYTTEEILSNKLYAIHSVKRLSDGEVFTVGDTIKTHKWGSDNIINSITIADGTNSFKGGIWLNCEGGTQHFSHSIKVIKKDYEVTQVLYATEIRTLINGEYRLYHEGVGFDLDYILNNDGKILSVRRLSDGEKFAIGDRIDISDDDIVVFRTISMINISSDGTLVIDHEHGGLTNCKDNGIFHRIKQAPLDYQIMSYIKKGSKSCITTKKRGGIYHDGFWDIYSVKRLSDGEIFKVGDDTDEGIISKIHVSKSYDGGIYINIKDKTFTMRLKYVKKPIFITHDGVNVSKPDTIWLLHKKTNTVSPYIIRSENDFSKLDLSGYICFSKKEKLNEYMLRHKPCLSLDDIQRAIHLPPMIWEALLETAKSKLNYDQDKTN